MAPQTSETTSNRVIIQSLSAEFARLYSLWRSLIGSCEVDLIYTQPELGRDRILPSIGESVLRSAAAVEQIFGGLTAGLWDDPFEWTLPETLTTPQLILEYLAEVDATRERAFQSFKSDQDLSTLISLPSGETQTLATLLLQTLLRACLFQGQASVTARLLSSL